MKQLLGETLRSAIIDKKNSFDLYSCAAELVSDSQIREIFVYLAQSTAQELERFLSIYPGDEFGEFSALLTCPSSMASPVRRGLLMNNADSIATKDVLGLLLREEGAFFLRYSAMVESIREPLLNKLFLQLLGNTTQRCRLIRAECLRIKGNDSMTPQ